MLLVVVIVSFIKVIVVCGVIVQSARRKWLDTREEFRRQRQPHKFRRIGGRNATKQLGLFEPFVRPTGTVAIVPLIRACDSSLPFEMLSLLPSSGDVSFSLY